MWDSKYIVILHPPLMGHVVPSMRIANFAIFGWNRRLAISETVRDRSMVPIVAGSIPVGSDDLSDPNPGFKVTVQLQVEYLKNGAF